eukprot:g1066.t1
MYSKVATTEANKIQQYLKAKAPPSSSNSLTNFRDEQYAWGAVDEVGVRKLIEYMKPTDTDVFVDIGSGKGALCGQIFEESLIKTVIGIEAMEKRHKEAVKTFYNQKEDTEKLLLSSDTIATITRKKGNRELHFVLGDALLKYKLWKDATIIFMHNFTFPDNVINDIFELIHHHCDNLRLILLAKPPSAKNIQDRYDKTMTDRIKVSWGTTKFYAWTPKKEYGTEHDSAPFANVNGKQ